MIEARPQLTVHRGELFSGSLSTGTAVHAASFIRLRRIVLEQELLARPDLFRLILAHELFHFAWVRLGNPARDAFYRLLARECQEGAKGEMGESSSVLKEMHIRKLNPVSVNLHNNWRWRAYVCESFCDTAAWFHLPDVPDLHRRLAVRWRTQRKHWCQKHLTLRLSC